MERDGRLRVLWCCCFVDSVPTAVSLEHVFWLASVVPWPCRSGFTFMVVFVHVETTFVEGVMYAGAIGHLHIQLSSRFAGVACMSPSVRACMPGGGCTWGCLMSGGLGFTVHQL
jgi:hypothetical protein